jgi:TolA-binding protein
MIGFDRLRSSKPACPAGWEITRALSQPETSADVVRHVRDCPTCAGLATELRTVISVAAEMLPVAPMSQASRDRISAALGAASAEAATTKRRRRVPAALAFAAALAGIAVLYGGWTYVARRAAKPQVAQGPAEAIAERGDKSVSLAKVRLFGEASFRRLSEPPDEIVRLASGRATFEVTHLTSEQRFRVVAGDGEVEVRGTRFEVEARDGALWNVAVTDGKVDVRVGDAVLRLQSGDEWQRHQPSPAAKETRAPSSTAPVAEHESSDSPTGHEFSGRSPSRPRGFPQAAERVAQANKESFDLAWSHLRRSEWDEATRAFGAVAAQAHGQALEEDALYWQAVATARAGRTQQASALLESFLQRFQEGARTGVATLALAWLRFDSGDKERARVLFERAALDSSAKVRQGADEGLRRFRIP